VISVLRAWFDLLSRWQSDEGQRAVQRATMKPAMVNLWDGTGELHPWRVCRAHGTPGPATRYGPPILVPADMATCWLGRRCVSAVVVQVHDRHGHHAEVWAAMGIAPDLVFWYVGRPEL